MISLDRRASRQHSGSMRFFHLSDLHLGKTLKGYDLLEDQAYVLDQVVAKLAELAPEALLIAGDIYDRAIPPVEAIRLFDAFLGKARAAVPGLRILVIPGNHDSAGRISFGASMLADSGLCIAARAEGKPAFVVESGGERAAVWALPFLTQASAPWEELASAGAEGEAGGSVGADGGEGAAGGAAPGRDASGEQFCPDLFRPQCLGGAVRDGAHDVVVSGNRFVRAGGRRNRPAGDRSHPPRDLGPAHLERVRARQVGLRPAPPASHPLVRCQGLVCVTQRAIQRLVARRAVSHQHGDDLARLVLEHDGVADGRLRAQGGLDVIGVDLEPVG